MNNALSQKNYSAVSGFIFALVALVHLWRIMAGWDVVVYEVAIPLWVSWVAVIVSGMLAYCGLSFGLGKDYGRRQGIDSLN